ncbi:MAG: tetratricopeptide repeat protein [Cyanobacteria bacterium P01_D01_bin.6]
MSLAQSAKEIAADPAAQYQALLRSLRRRKGFGLVFVQASPAKAYDVIQQIQSDLPQKAIGSLTLDRPINNLYQLIAQRPDLQKLNILFIQGIEKSLDEDVKPGYGGEGDYYNLDTVPPLLSHLNQQRDNFRDQFSQLCLVFFLSNYGLRYFMRRAADFSDWNSAIFRFTEQRKVGNLDNSKEDFSYLELFSWKKFKQVFSNPIKVFRELHQYLSTSIWKTVGDFLLNIELHGLAITCYEAALSVSPNLYSILNRKGIALRRMGEYKEALEQYDLALNVKPDYHSALHNKGFVLIKMERYEEAVANFTAALEIKPKYSNALHKKGIALRELGRHEEAIQTYDSLLSIKPTYHQAWGLRGISLCELGLFDEAQKSYDRVLELKHNDDFAFYKKACCHSLQGKIKPALKNLERAIQLSPNKYSEMAKTDSDFDSIRGNPRFEALIEGKQRSWVSRG